MVQAPGSPQFCLEERQKEDILFSRESDSGSHQYKSSTCFSSSKLDKVMVLGFTVNHLYGIWEDASEVQLHLSLV